MGQFQDTIYHEHPVVIRDVTASQFAAQANGAPKHPGIRYRVDGQTEYQWNGAQWVAMVSAAQSLTGRMVFSTYVTTEAALRAALLIGDYVTLGANIAIADTLTISENTTLDLNNYTLSQATGTNKKMLVNSAYYRATYAVTISATAGVATINWTAHGLHSGDAVGIAGATEGDYNGVFLAASVTADTITVKLPTNVTGSATGSPVARKADKNIRIINGTIDYDKTNNAAASGLNTMAVILAHTWGASAENVFGKDAAKYVWLIANSAGFTCDNLEFSTFSDGLHFQTPLLNPNVGYIHGYTGDDLCAITVGDYAAYEVTRGDARGVNIDHIHGRAALELFRIAGNSPFKIHDVAIGKLSGTVTTTGWSIRDDTNLTNTLVGAVTIGEIAVDSVQETQLFKSVGTGQIDNIRVIKGKKLNASSAWLKFNASNVSRFRCDDYEDTTLGTGFSLDVTGASGTYGSIEFGNIRWVATSGTPSCVVLEASGTTTLQRLLIENVQATGDSSGRFCVRTGAFSVSNIEIGQFYGTINRAYGESNTPSNTCTIKLGKVSGSLQYCAALSCSPTVVLDEIYATCLSAVVNVGGTAQSPTIRAGKIITTSTHVNAGSNTCRAIGEELKADGSKVAGSVAGDRFYNTNSAWASGTGTDKSGLYGYTGAAYTKLFGPA